jgi:hypothetical protein
MRYHSRLRYIIDIDHSVVYPQPNFLQMRSRYPRANTSALESLGIGLTLGLLSLYFLIKRFHLGESFPFADHLSLNTAQKQDCNLDIFEGAWTPPVRCLNSFLEEVFALPIAYLAVTLLLKFALLYAVYLLYQSIRSRPRNNLDPPLHDQINTVCLFGVLFVTILGGGRLFIGGADLLLNSTIASRQWAQLLVLLGIALFFGRKFLSAGIIVGLALFIHPANVFHIILVLFFAILVGNPSSSWAMTLTRFSTPAFGAVAVQYLATYGFPDLPNAINALSGTITTPASDVFDTQSVQDWYDFIFSQDPDDLSLVWVVTHQQVYLYAPFITAGLYFAWRVERPSHIQDFFTNPAITVCVVTIGYLIVCLMVEIFRAPTFILKYLIVLQPRRILYLPPLLLSFFIIRHTIQFFQTSSHRNLRSFLELATFYSCFYGVLAYGSYGAHVHGSLALIAAVGMLLALTVFFAGSPFVPAHWLVLLSRSRFFVLVAVLLVVLKTIPFLNHNSISQFNSTFLTTERRTLSDHLAVAASINNNDKYKSYLEMTHWINENLALDDRFLTAGLDEMMVVDLPLLLKGRDFLSLNLYFARGGTHYDNIDYRRKLTTFGKIFSHIRWYREDLVSSFDSLHSFLTSLSTEQIIEIARNAHQVSCRECSEYQYIISSFRLPLEVRADLGYLKVYEL